MLLQSFPKYRSNITRLDSWDMQRSENTWNDGQINSRWSPTNLTRSENLVGVVVPLQPRQIFVNS